MVKLVMEAVMIIVIISGLVFITKVTANENKIEHPRTDEGESGDEDPDKPRPDA
ncbi:MAG: hypothetical protein ABL933_18740 [Methyloglobulus sp.]|nr:hypothetical protein [Methyloglobulus sp.]